MSVIDQPIDLFTIKEKIKDGEYQSVSQWRMDIELMFRNCKIFNEEKSDIYISCIKLQKFFMEELKNYGLTGGITNSGSIKIYE